MAESVRLGFTLLALAILPFIAPHLSSAGYRSGFQGVE
jgi:hypothetical protein